MPPWLRILSTGVEVARAHKSTHGLNWSLTRIFLTVAFGDEDASSRYDCSIQHKGAVYTMTVGVFLLQDAQSKEHEVESYQLNE